MSKIMDRFIDKLDKAGMTIKFGLKAQGHIPTIEKMLKKGKSWDEIGKKINWCPKTAKEWYQEEKDHDE